MKESEVYIYNFSTVVTKFIKTKGEQKTNEDRNRKVRVTELYKIVKSVFKKRTKKKHVLIFCQFFQLMFSIRVSR